MSNGSFNFYRCGIKNWKDPSHPSDIPFFILINF